MKSSGGQNNHNKQELSTGSNNLINRNQQTRSPNQTNTSLDNLRNQHTHIGHKLQQRQQYPPRHASSKPQVEKEKWTIFDQWVAFRDKYLADTVNNGFQKLGFFGKFAYQKAVNSGMAHNIKQQIQQEGSNIKERLTEVSRSTVDRFSSNKNDNENPKKSVIYEKLIQGKGFAEQKLGEGAEILREKYKEKAGENSEILKDKLDQGAGILKDKVLQGAGVVKDTLKKSYEDGSPIVKEKVSQGADVLKDTLKKGYEQGKPIVKDKVQQGAGIVKDALKKGYEQGMPLIKEKAEQLSNASTNSAKGLGDAASKAASDTLNSISSAPDMMAKKAQKYVRRTGLYVFLGATCVAFAYAIGSRLPHAYFDYQLKKEQLQKQSEPNKN